MEISKLRLRDFFSHQSCVHKCQKLLNSSIKLKRVKCLSNDFPKSKLLCNSEKKTSKVN